MSTISGNGLISIPSKHSVEETVTRLTEALTAKNIKLFAIIDHSGEAANAGLSMPATRVVLFGNPAGGTPLMLASPSAAIDLPLKLLVAENDQKAVTITWNSPAYLGLRHGVPEPLLANIAAIANLARHAAG